MAENTGRTGNGLYFIVGGLVVAVLVIGFLVFGGSFGASDKASITIEVPKVPAPRN